MQPPAAADLQGYDYTLNSRCVAALLTHRESAGRLEALFSRLQAAPHTAGDYHENDSQGRRLQVVLFEDWLITFWVDHADKKVHIIDLDWIE